MTLNRRRFIRNAALTTAGTYFTAALPFDLLAAIRKKHSPLDSIGVGVIGVRGQGWNNISSMLKLSEIQCVALCDIDQTVLDQRKGELEKLKQRPILYTDYRKMLENRDVDVVIIATPDHWHCLQMADACAAGKDVFLEKPVSNSIYEANLMTRAASRYKTIVQVAQWQRSQEHFKKAIEFVHSGRLGKIATTKAWMFRGGTTPLPEVPDSRVPPGVDYKLWLGPARERPFNKNRFHYEFRWFWDYAGGLMTDWGVHLIDMILMGMKAELPRSVTAQGGKYIFPGDARETPDLQTAIYDFGNFQMTWEHNMGTGLGYYGLQHGIAFIGENGTLLLNRRGWEVKPYIQRNVPKMEAIPWQEVKDHGLDMHTKNFIDVVRSRKTEDLNCPIEAGALVAIVSHMGNIAVRTAERIDWNTGTKRFEQKKANELMKPDYQNGWKLPE